MQTRPSAASFAAAALAAFAATAPAFAADYYVATTGDDANNTGATAESPFATIDHAIECAVDSSDVIYVAPGTYSTTTANGPTLKAKLVGTGETRDDVVIQPGGTSRALKMDTTNAWIENVTVIGEQTFQVTTGGAIYMTGGTITNCVIRNGTAKANGNVAGGNLYVNSDDALVIDCEIYGGSTHKRGGNLYLDHGLVSHCVIHDGICDDNIGGNVYLYQGTISNCVIYGGSALNDGGNVRMNGSGTMVDCVISNGVITSASSATKKGANVYMDSTARMSRCRLVGGSHSGGYNGGSLAIGADTAITEDCLIEKSQCGGVLFVGTSYLYNCTVVNNDKFGIWAWNTSAHVFNTVIYGNTENGSNKDWTGNMPTASTAEFLNNAVTESGSRHTKTDYPTVVLLADDSAFTDYASGDYSPASGGALVDAGASDPRGAGASATDLAGNPRASGTIDIGCYEYQKSEMTVRIEGATYSPVFAPATVTFSHVVENSADPDSVVFTYDFGDESATEETTAATIAHTYTAPGIYTVTVSAASACEDDVPASMIYEGYVRVASSTIYVTPGNGAGTFPFDTAETGYGSLKTAVQAALDGYTLLLGEGVHETVDQVSFNKAITIRGLGATPDAVVVSNTTANPNTYYHRTMEMNNANGRIENITIANGCVKNQFGGNLRLVTGVVSNCIIRGGLAVADNGNAGGAAVELAGAGTLTHCVISNNVVQGSSNSGSYAGGAITVQFNAKNGRVSNCLIVHNRYVTSGDTVKAGAAGIRFGGSNDNTQIENNTIAANTVEGSLADDSAGVYCTTWYGRLRNNIIVGNYETGKEKFTSVKLDFNSSNNYTYHNNITDDAVIAESGTKSQNNKLASATSLFKNFAGGDFRIRSSGTAFNGGTLSGLTLLPAFDLAGNPRVMYDRIDVGCFECQNLPATVFILR